jgi:RNA polymerase-binding transcription factor DksA
MMKKELLNSLAELLRSQRNNYLLEFRKAEAGLDSIAEERESELEEHAQEEQSARFLTRLDDRTLFAVKEIDAALERIIKASYGVCESCRKTIAVARLQSLPATRFCRRCAAQNEQPPVAIAEAPEAPSKAPIPGDLNLLSDHDMAEVIREHLKEDGRIDMEELHVVCRKGVVYVSGKLPSEAEHQILLHTLTDVLGFEEIVDHLDVEELLWQSDQRARELVPEVTARWEDSPGNEDIVETNEEGKEFVAPAKPTPDEQ